MNETPGAHRHRVVVLILNALQTSALVDNVSRAVFGCELEGKRIEGFITNDTIRKLNVVGNAQIIYYVKQKTAYKGVNKTICSDLTAWFNGEGIDRITFRNKPESTVFPMAEIVDTEMRLKHFVWFENKRPKKKNDILIR